VKLGGLTDLRVALGGEAAVSERYACGLKRAAGCSGTRQFDIHRVVRWRQRHPEFKITDVYKDKRRRKAANVSGKL